MNDSHPGSVLEASEALPLRLGIDNGRSGLKAVSGRKRFTCAPIVGRGTTPQGRQYLSTAGDTTTGHLVWMEYKGTQWLVGEGAALEGAGSSTAMDLKKATETGVVQIMAAIGHLAPLRPIAQEVECCVALPAARYTKDRHELAVLLQGDHTLRMGEDSDRSFTVRGRIVPEGLGLFLRAATLESGGLDDEMVYSTCVVMDIGHRTTNLIVMRGLTNFFQGRTETHGGVVLSTRAFKALVEEPLDTVLSEDMRAGLLTQLFRTGRMQIQGQTITQEAFGQHMRAAAIIEWPRIEAALHDLLEGMPYSYIVVGGGASHWYAQEITTQFSGRGLTYLPCRFAQAEGHQLFLKHQEFLGI